MKEIRKYIRYLKSAIRANKKTFLVCTWLTACK